MSKSDFIVIDAKNRAKEREILDRQIEVLYMKAFMREVTKLERNAEWKEDRETIKKSTFYAVKYYGMNRVVSKYENKPRTYDQVQNDFTLLECVKQIMAELSPRELMSMFPITKTYDGEKWGEKDYFFTVDAMKKYDTDSPIGARGLEDILWDYQNMDLWEFSATSFSIISNIYRLQNGGRGIMEEWAAEMNIPTYTFNDKKGYMINNSTGEISSVKKEPEFKVLK